MLSFQSDEHSIETAGVRMDAVVSKGRTLDVDDRGSNGCCCLKTTNSQSRRPGFEWMLSSKSDELSIEMTGVRMDAVVSKRRTLNRDDRCSNGCCRLKTTNSQSRRPGFEWMLSSKSDELLIEMTGVRMDAVVSKRRTLNRDDRGSNGCCRLKTTNSQKRRPGFEWMLLSQNDELSIEATGVRVDAAVS